jgi:hypothetical protein
MKNSEKALGYLRVWTHNKKSKPPMSFAERINAHTDGIGLTIRSKKKKATQLALV